MADTKKTQNKSSKSNNTNNTNKSTKTRSSGKNTGKKKNSSDDTMKLLLVLVIAGIAIALIFFSRSKENQADGTGTPTPTMAAEPTGVTESATVTTAPSQNTDVTEPARDVTKAPSSTPVPTNTPAPTNTPIPTSTPTPTPALSATEAEQVVAKKVDASVYTIQLVNDNLVVGNGRYYQFGAIKNQEFILPFLVVNMADGSLHFYDSTEDTVYDFTKFPLAAEVIVTPTPTPEPAGKLTVQEAYNVLGTYSKEVLNTPKEVSEYEPEYGEELTFINGADCYRINLIEYSNGKRRNRGEFYVSVDGTKCYYLDSNTNEFVLVEK